MYQPSIFSKGTGGISCTEVLSECETREYRSFPLRVYLITQMTPSHIGVQTCLESSNYNAIFWGTRCSHGAEAAARWFGGKMRVQAGGCYPQKPWGPWCWLQVTLFCKTGQSGLGRGSWIPGVPVPVSSDAFLKSAVCHSTRARPVSSVFVSLPSIRCQALFYLFIWSST